MPLANDDSEIARKKTAGRPAYEPAQFFRVRFWNRQAIIDAVLEHYNELDEEIRAELPLKRIWTVAAEEED